MNSRNWSSRSITKGQWWHYLIIIEDANRTLATIPTAIITETDELVYATAIVILEMLGLKKNNNLTMEKEAGI